jgi:hypothetical protein
VIATRGEPPRGYNSYRHSSPAFGAEPRRVKGASAAGTFEGGSAAIGAERTGGNDGTGSHGVRSRRGSEGGSDIVDP